MGVVIPCVHTWLWFLFPLYRLLSLSKSSLPQGDSHYIAGMHPEMDPEQSHGLFSVLTGEKKLVDKWVVSFRVCYARARVNGWY